MTTESSDYVDHPEDVVSEDPSDTNIEAVDRFDRLFRANAHSELSTDPLPEVGVKRVSAFLTLVVNHEAYGTFEIVDEITRIGHYHEEKGEIIEVNLADFDPNNALSRRHCSIYSQNNNYTLHVTSNAGTQVNGELLELGAHVPLQSGDVVVLAGYLCLKFDLQPVNHEPVESEAHEA